VKRDANLDLVKWLAMLTMVLDHLRYLWPQAADWLFVIGRLAFPLFCLGIAANVFRSRPGQLYTDGNARYLAWLLAFSILSELPYRLLSTESSTLNIMPTLMLGLLIAWGVHHRGRDGLLLGVMTLAVVIVLHERLMYGVFGALLPAALLLAIQRPGPGWLLPAALCVLANSRNRWAVGWELHDLGGSITVEFMAPLLGLWLLRMKIDWRVWPVRRWGYLFYPGHMAVLSLFRPVL
jgi:hypothetical protein